MTKEARALLWLNGLPAVAVVVCLTFFPLFHIVPLQQAREAEAATVFDPAKFAETFWSEKLMKSFDRATPAEMLLPVIQSDPAAARKRYGRTLGMSESYTYYVAGTGRVVGVTDDGVALAISAGATNAEVILPTGLLFGNTLRDGTGLLDVNDYPNSQDFNGIAEALNHLVETRVLPSLKTQAHVGTQIRFVGCAEVDDETSDLRPLHVIPVFIEAK